MDYKYIEQLLERYWDCQTTLEEERILRSFFSQDDVPARLLQYKPLFDIQAEDAEERLGEEFDARIIGAIEQTKTVKLARRTFKQRIMPMVKAAAAVAVFITIGNMVNETIADKTEETPIADSYVRTEEINKTFTVEEAKKTASADSIATKKANITTATK